MEQSKLNLPNALPKLGEPFFVFVHPTPELVFFFFGNSRRLFPLRKTEPQSMTATSTSLIAISDVATTAMLNNAWSVWDDLGPLGGVNKGRSILNIKSRCVTYVRAVTFNWLSKPSNCNYVSCQYD